LDSDIRPVIRTVRSEKDLGFSPRSFSLVATRIERQAKFRVKGT
jgi:hypothetical protein